MSQYLLTAICATALLMSNSSPVSGQDFLLMNSRLNADGQFSSVDIQGRVELADTPLPPASTFKTVIAWAGLESGRLSLDTEILCSDSFIPDAPRKLRLEEAMRLSSNDYFVEAVRRIGHDSFVSLVNRSGFLQETVPDNWLRNHPKATAHAGDQKVTARHLHHWMEQIASKGLSKNSKINRELLQSMTWKEDEAGGYKIYGKTGTHFGVARFIAIIEKSSGEKYVVSSLVPYRRGVDDARTARNQAVELVEKFASRR